MEIKLKVGYSSNDFYGADYCSVFLLSNLIGSIIKVGVRDRAYKKISKK